MSDNNLVTAITPTSVSGVPAGVIMFVHPPETAATQLAHFITPKLVRDLYESLPAGAVPEQPYLSLMEQIKSYLLTGQPISASFAQLAGLILSSTAAPASPAAGQQLAGLITGAMVRDIITLVAPTIPAAIVVSSITLLKTDLTAGLGIEPWLKTMATAFGGLGTSTAHQA